MKGSIEILAGISMLNDLAHQYAANAGINLSDVHLDNGHPLGCRDIHLLSIISGGKTATSKITHEEIADHQDRACSEMTRDKVRIRARIGSYLALSDSLASTSLTAEEVTSVIEGYYANGIVKDVIWDIAMGSLGAITEEGYKAIAHSAHEILKSGSRKGGKTAYVGHANLERDLLQMYMAIAKTTGVPIRYKVFETIEKARDWIAR